MLAAKDADVYNEMVAVMHMRRDEKALLSPQMMLKVLAFKASKWWKQVTGDGSRGESRTASV
jgi:hypothetical protein